MPFTIENHARMNDVRGASIRGTSALGATALLLSLLSLAPAADAQFARPGQLPAMDAAIRAAVVDSLTAVIDSVYVLEAPAGRIVAGLRQNLSDGAYADITDPAEFAQKLQQDAQQINHDGHFGIAALLPLDPSVVEAELDEDPADAARQQRLERAQNYGFKKAEILTGGIGYLRFDRFSHGDEAFAAAVAAMNFLANSNALIIDLRYNCGGSASMIRLICGYLFAEDTHLVNWDIRAEKKTVQSYSPDYVPGRRLTEQPVYILTSGNTFSAAEEFTFDLRNLERATLVGETTGGGGHTVSSHIFDFGDFRMGIRVPRGRAYNPENNEGWEGAGVAPHIAVPPERALEAAHADALRRLIEDEADERYKARLQWALVDVDSRIDPIALTEKQMKEYAGQYGPRRIFIENGALLYQREDRPRMKLEPMGEDLFRVGDLDYFRAAFARDPRGRIVKFIGRYDDGTTDEHQRDAR
ncbi:S41 family peptidase [bacterium]|nr:S41 family peptidase [bacterium]MBU1074267.1 S41 family peptidase [bacterium]MBU1676439.1 S41 family peptidase [bacterium]